MTLGIVDFGYGADRHDLDVAELYRDGVLQRLRVDDDLAFVPLLARTFELEFRQRDAQYLIHIYAVGEQVGPDAFDHAGHLEPLSVDVEPHDLLRRVGVVQFGDIPEDERRDEQRQKDGRDIAVRPFEEAIHVGRIFRYKGKNKMDWRNRALH